MTRLTIEDLRKGPNDLNVYDQRLKVITNLGLLELALETTAMTLEQYRSRVTPLSWVAVVPITMGQGILPGFSKKVAEVGCFLGLPCKVTEARDVAGWGEAVRGGSEMILCADDETFLALNLISRRVVDDTAATGEVYAAALAAAAEGVAERPVGVLGLGAVGQAATAWLHSQGAHLIVHDRNQKRQADFLLRTGDIKGADSVGEVLGQTNLVLDATNASNIIKVRELKRHLILAAPGIPLGIDDPNSHMVQLIHDPLQLGVAAMMVQALA
ncbi:MAG: 3-methylornithyl-N6-L-lysine dehydrogenase PylD [Desulfobacteraceae bacterium]|nr:3-methylornithyl-N6-L-lysine dehydrogenase PylD [Desulfobacteraceae bacterium]